MGFTRNGIPIRNRGNKDLFPQSDLLNERREHSDIKRWWNVPYVDELSYEEIGAISVSVLDGETWDGPRKISEHSTFQEAVAAANFYVSHSQWWRRYHEPYKRSANVGHLTDMSACIHGKIGKPTEQELFDYMFHWLPASDEEQNVLIESV